MSLTSKMNHFDTSTTLVEPEPASRTSRLLKALPSARLGKVFGRRKKSRSASKEGSKSPKAKQHVSRPTSPSQCGQDTPSPQETSISACPDVTVVAAPTPSYDLWDIAYDELRKADGKRILVERFEKLLSSKLKTLEDREPVESGHPDNGTIDSEENRISKEREARRGQMKEILDMGRENMRKQALKLRVGTWEVDFRDKAEKAAGFIEWFQSWAGKASQASLESTLVWAAVSLTFPLLTNPVDARQSRDEGFKEVLALTKYYTAHEHEILGRSGNNKEELRERILKTYKAVLEFQVHSALCFHNSRFERSKDYILRPEKWNTMLDTIKSRHEEVRTFSQTIGLAETLGKLDEIKEEVKDVPRQLAQVTDLLCRTLEVNEEALALTRENNQIQKSQTPLLKEIHEAVVMKQTKEIARSEEEEEILKLLTKNLPSYGTSPEAIKDLIPGLVEGTGRWLLQNGDYQQWLAEPSGLLLISGNPGCGKSVISKHLIDHALPDAGHATVCYFFFDQHEIAQALCTLLHQLFTARPNLLKHATSAYQRYQDMMATRPDVLWKVLEEATLSEDTRPVALVLDALDQCPEDIAGFIGRRYRSGRLKISITTRAYSAITAEVEASRGGPLYRIFGELGDSTSIISEEVALVVKSQISTLGSAWPAKAKARLQEKMLQVRNPTYLWVRLIFEALQPRRGGNEFLPSLSNIEKLISKLPQSVNEAYDMIIDTAANEDAFKPIMGMIIAAKRPLTVREMNVAIHLSPSTTSFQELKDDVIDLIDDDAFEHILRQWSGLFIIIEKRRIYFLHETAKEFFTMMPTSTSPKPCLRWQGSISLNQAHTTILEACMRVLLLTDLLDESGQPELLEGERLPKRILLDEVFVRFRESEDAGFPFAIYASLNWTEHVRVLGPVPPPLESAYERLCDLSNGLCLSWLNLYLYSRLYIMLAPSNLNTISLKALMGHRTQVMEDVRNDNLWLDFYTPESECEDCLAQPLPPLLAAIMGEHLELAKDLLDNGANPNQTFMMYSPLDWIMEANSSAMRGLIPHLLQKGASTTPVSLPGYDSLPCPLYVAAKRGTATVAETLLVHEKSIGSADPLSIIDPCWGQTPFHVVSNPETMKVLLQHRVDSPLVKDEKGYTPLATVCGVELKKMLLEACHSEITQAQLRQALDRACNAAEVALLFEYGADSRTNGTLPLLSDLWDSSWPQSATSQVEMLQKLLKHCDPEARNELGETALLKYVSVGGTEVVVKGLLAHGVDGRATDCHGRTALHLACSRQSPSVSVVQLLLNNLPKDTLSARDRYGRTAEHYARDQSHIELVDLLVKYGLDIEAVASDGRTPLPCAISS
ncbi:hypothetical protein SODALDRAFT_51881 [Sodiomyces alkalinus F11]|uniref:NACHT domain-containing protein n=1 Tax=Sodiomyces alkalinus (strain CBS 110278 / VKM F-3762 / F11) TaxID=1314773 RepID=A0A3N2PN13_SODAK|nr:hypothetical protein SODALDRAFT_51881 [Sodiomyces alkalinus F11]ROT35814.1 hypothetical protein SODALDRAFT_51881 [Sodiomyces alkalinus F11]